MNTNQRCRRLGAALSCAALLLAAAGALAAQKKGAAAPAGTAAEQALAAYLARVKQAAGEASRTTGSLYTPQGRYINLSTDFKAQNPNDLITIHILEATQATGSGSLQSKRSFNATSGFSGFFGPLASTSRLSSLLAPNSSSDLEGQAATASSSQLETSLTGRVVDVLPNGNLVVEAVRTISMNNEQQTVVVHGVVRPADIAPDNSVLSTQVGELEIELLGKGVISDTNHPLSGWMHLLMKFLTF
ncbi:MAG TPA: flagellar basal body L-ring protein FlgH [Terriglobales bacterium]|nr:flagellar basal body L-ring protein FlgH [Terriglobales bacterium]